jgi:hypothetical protein
VVQMAMEVHRDREGMKRKEGRIEVASAKMN